MGYFSPRRVCHKVPKLCMRSFSFFYKKEKCLESPEMVNNWSVFFFYNFPPPPRHVRWIISAGVDGGLGGGSSIRRPGNEDPRQRKFSMPYFRFTMHKNNLSFVLFYWITITSPEILKIVAGIGRLLGCFCMSDPCPLPGKMTQN